MQKLIIEARINEYSMRDANRNVPWTPQEIAEDAAQCRAAGASIVHFHARTQDGGPDHSIATYADIIRRIKERTDILVHPTLGSARTDRPVPERLKPVLELAGDPSTRPDILPLCLGSPNWDFYDPDQNRFVSPESVFINTTENLRVSATILRDAGIGLSCVCWDIGAVRRLDAFMDAGIIPEPAYMSLHLTSGGMLSGHPATPEGLQTLLNFLPKRRPIEWAVINLHGSLLPLAEAIIRDGGHIQIGIGDYPYPELGAPSNADLVRLVADMAARHGREIASPDEARALLQLSTPPGHR